MNIGTLLFGIAAWGSWFALTWLFLLDIVSPTVAALIVWVMWLLMGVGASALSSANER
ncbi:MAG: hypothetical protein H8D74_00940 [Chloroflexi bacterium]|nr:hypothetical protein [Chloroflexota bacterium]